MNLRQLLSRAGIRNDIIKEVEKKAKKTTAEQELEHQERAMAMTKVLLNEALRARKAAEEKAPPFPKKTIITGDDQSFFALVVIGTRWETLSILGRKEDSDSSERRAPLRSYYGIKTRTMG